jgi:hypothetical protein
MCIPSPELDLVRIFVEKYDMIGVLGFVNFLTLLQQEKYKRLQEIETLTQNVKRVEAERAYDVKRMEDEIKRFKN